MTNQKEYDTVRKVLAGNTDLFEHIINNHKDGLFYHCFKILHNEDAAEDATQESFIKAYRSLKSYRAENQFNTWLFTIATRTCIDMLRRDKHLTTLDALEYTPSEDLSTEENLSKQLEAEALKRCIGKLNATQRTAINLFYFEAIKIDEIAVYMNTTPGNVKVMLNRARNTLRKELSR